MVKPNILVEIEDYYSYDVLPKSVDDIVLALKDCVLKIWNMYSENVINSELLKSREIPVSVELLNLFN